MLPLCERKDLFYFWKSSHFFYIPCKSLQIVKKVQIVKCIRNLINHRYLLFENFFFLSSEFSELFHDGGPYHIETSPLICRANHWTGFYMRRTSYHEKLKAWFLCCKVFWDFWWILSLITNVEGSKTSKIKDLGKSSVVLFYEIWILALKITGKNYEEV